jgi:hypothetical protein
MANPNRKVKIPDVTARVKRKIIRADVFFFYKVK